MRSCPSRSSRLLTQSLFASADIPQDQGRKDQVVEELHAVSERASVQADLCRQALPLLWALGRFRRSPTRWPDHGEHPAALLVQSPSEVAGQGAFKRGVMPSGRMRIDTGGKGGFAAVAARTILLGKDPLLGQSPVTPLPTTASALPLPVTAGMRKCPVGPAKFLGKVPVERGRSHGG